MVAAQTHMVSLGFGKYARADRIFALDPLRGDDRGDGQHTRVWIEGIGEPLIALAYRANDPARHGSRATVAGLRSWTKPSTSPPRLADAADAGRVDLNDLGRRARRLLAAFNLRRLNGCGRRGAQPIRSAT